MIRNARGIINQASMKRLGDPQIGALAEGIRRDIRAWKAKVSRSGGSTQEDGEPAPMSWASEASQRPTREAESTLPV